MSEAEWRLELACALYSRARISAVAGSHLAETDLITFQGVLAGRNIPRSYSASDLHNDLAAMDRILGEGLLSRTRPSFSTSRSLGR
jgi:predicted HTH domain antitoxin